MCGLFGFVNYSGRTLKGAEKLATYLSHASAERGTHATGVAYVLEGKMNIDKAPKSAYAFKIGIPEDTPVLMGHTRYTTQGHQKKNYNNHPFRGQTKMGEVFALAHNGVIYNDYEVRADYKLPFTKIQTDSYVAVQLLELWGQWGELSHDAMKFMGEKVCGMFTFTVLDENNNLYIVKNDSPLSILHFKNLGLYVYASTRSILMEAIMNTTLGDYFMDEFLPYSKGKRKGKTKALSRLSIELLEPEEGEIWKILNTGEIEKSKYEPQDDWYSGVNNRVSYYNSKTGKYLTDYANDYDDYGTYSSGVCSVNTSSKTDTKTEQQSDEELYYEMLYSIAEGMGFKKTEIDLVREWGYSLMEVEQALYDNTFIHLLDEVRAFYQEPAVKAVEESEHAMAKVSSDT